MKAGWKTNTLENCLERFRIPAKVQRKQFREVGAFPIVSQEADFVNGYWDEAEDVCVLDRPVVIFGDHTQVLKYVDFDFVVGADGVKVLAPKPFIDTKYLYYFVMANRSPSLGYARHYRHVKELAVSYPSPEEQRRIVAILDEAFEGLDRARANAEANLQNARELFSGTIEGLLKRGGGVPLTLSEMLERKWITGHLDGNHGSSYPRKDEFVSAGVPYISANCIDGDLIDLSRCKFLSPERADTLRKGVAQDRDVIFAHNATVGPVALLTTEEPRVLLSTSLTYYRCDESRVSPEFLVYEMRSASFKRQYEAVMEQATRNQVPITMQRTFTHIIPPLEWQLKIVEIGTEIENKTRDLERAYMQEITDLTDLRQSLLQKAFAGELT